VTLSGEDEAVVPRLVKMLQDGRIDAFIEAEAVVNHYLKQQRIKSLVMAGCTATFEAFVGFSPVNPKSKERAELFDKAVMELRKEGKIAEILSNYDVADWR
jgi:polar amino acid transport system substrate-binding protein